MSSFLARQGIAILWGLLLTIPLGMKSHAALDDLPFIGDKFPFTLTIENYPTLNDDASEALRTQRSESPEFRSINRPRGAARFDRDVILRWMRSEGFFFRHAQFTHRTGAHTA